MCAINCNGWDLPLGISLFNAGISFNAIAYGEGNSTANSCNLLPLRTILYL